MINKINGISLYAGINQRAKISFKADDSAVTVPEIKSENKGMDALAAYNAAIVKKAPVSKDKLELEPVKPFTLAPENFDNIEGEKIYTSDGKLNSIIRRDENTYTVYTPDENNEKLFATIETYDKKNNRNVIKSQSNEIKDGKYTSVYVEENDPQTGKTLRYSRYNDGVLYSLGKTIREPNGREIDINCYEDDKEYYVIASYPDYKNKIYARFDKNKQLLSISEDKEYKNKKTSTEIEFFNGAPTNIHFSKDIIISNTIGLNYIKQDILKPAEHFEKPDNLKDIDGEKKYYSNGALESLTFNSDNGETTAYFTPEGNCYKIESDNLSYFENYTNEIITEKLQDGSTKETSLYKTGCKNVQIKNGSSYKEIGYEKDGKPSYYEEGIIDKDNEKKAKIYLSYTNGNVDYAREYNND